MFLIGIAGGSGSGKTTFAKRILQRLPPEVSDGVSLLHLDSFYLSSPPTHLKIHGRPNFDHPGAFDWDLIREQLSILREGGAVETPVYDFRTSRRTQQTQLIGPCKAIIMEGIFALWDPAVRNLFDLKIYLNVDADIRFIRRLQRDVIERGRTVDSIIRQYYDTVRPMHHEFLEPTRQYANIVVGEETDIAADVVAARVNQIAMSFSGTLPGAVPVTVDEKELVS